MLNNYGLRGIVLISPTLSASPNCSQWYSATYTAAQARDLVYDLVPSDRPGTSAMEVVAHNLDQGEHDHSFRYFFRDKIYGRTSDLGTAGKIVLYGRSATDKPCLVQLSLITADGVAYGATLPVQPEHGRYSVPVSALQQVRSPNIPHGYPVFIPFWSSIKPGIPLDLSRAESVLVSIGPGLTVAEYPEPQGVQIERIWLE